MAFPFSILSDQGIVEPGACSVKNGPGRTERVRVKPLRGFTATTHSFIDVPEGFAKDG